METNLEPSNRGEPHLPFLEELASMVADDPRWAPTVAGFVALRLVDKWAESLNGWIAPRPSEVTAVRSAIDKLVDSQVSNALTAVVDAVTDAWGRRKTTVSNRVLAYADILYNREAWRLAADVCRTFLSFAAEDSEADLCTQTWNLLGRSLCFAGDLEGSEAAHARALMLAQQHSQRYQELVALHGLAIVTVQLGNLPEADAQLEAVADACRVGQDSEPSLADVYARALHDRGWIAIRRRQMDNAFRLLGEAMNCAVDSRRRDRILHDLATAYAQIGDRDTARKAMRLIEHRTSEQRLRWLAALNLMDYACRDDAETVFEHYRRQLAAASLPPRLAAYYHILVGEGCRRFGRESSASAAFAQAIKIAQRHSLNELVFEAENAQRAVANLSEEKRVASGLIRSEEAQRVAQTIDELTRELVGVDNS